MLNMTRLYHLRMMLLSLTYVPIADSMEAVSHTHRFKSSRATLMQANFQQLNHCISKLSLQYGLIIGYYYTHFEITDGPCNLIGSNWCD